MLPTAYIWQPSSLHAHLSRELGDKLATLAKVDYGRERGHELYASARWDDDAGRERRKILIRAPFLSLPILERGSLLHMARHSLKIPCSYILHLGASSPQKKSFKRTWLRIIDKSWQRGLLVIYV